MRQIALAPAGRSGYPSRVSPLAALLCALPLLPAQAQEWSEFNRPYMESVVGLLKRLRSTREHWAFVSRERVDLEVTDNPAHVDDSVVGAYDMIERRMFLDQVRLMDGAEQMIDDGAPAKTTAEVLAWKSLPTIVHELTHARVHERVRKLMGRPIAFPSVEDEQLAFYEGCLALFEMFEERPELWEPRRILSFEKVNADILRAWLAGPGVLDAVVRETYDNRPELLKEEPEKLLALVDARIKSESDLLAKMRRTRRTIESVGLERAGIPRRTYEDLADNLRYVERSLAVDVSTREALSDPARLERLRAFYRSELADRRARLEARRPKKAGRPDE